MTWTTERIELLKAHFTAGLSCGQIARTMGMSRNAVIGKLNRLGLSRPKAVGPRPAERKKAPEFRRPRLVTHNPAMALRLDPFVAEDEAPISSAARCSLLELTAAKCRWPIGDPGSASFRFCGTTQTAGLPYCAAHARMAYRRQTPRAAGA